MDRSVLIAGAAALLLAGMPVVAATPPVPGAIAAAVASPDRSDEDKARDADRKPAELLAFAGVRPGWRVVELAPGAGYFTRMLSLAVGPDGHVYANTLRPAPEVEAWARTHGNVTVTNVSPGEKLAPESVDLVWTTQNYHDFRYQVLGGDDVAALINRTAFAALRPGGVYLVSDHQAAAGAGATQTETLHRVEDAAVIREVEAAGFKLDARSDMLRHPADDHTKKVFDPGLRGKTDQFVLRFRKPGGGR